MAELQIYKELPNQSIHKVNSTHRHSVSGALVSVHQVTANGEQKQNSTLKVDERYATFFRCYTDLQTEFNKMYLGLLDSLGDARFPIPLSDC